MQENNGFDTPPTPSSEQQVALLMQSLLEKEAALAQRDVELAKQQDIIRQLETKLDQSQREYLKLWEERFRARSERYIADPDQLRIDFGNTDEAADAAQGLAEAVEEAQLIPAHRRRTPKQRDESLPAHLPREEVIAKVAAEAQTCPEHGPKTLLPVAMWDVSEKLVYIPGTLKVVATKYPKYACPNRPECGVSAPERPTGLVEGDKYDSSVATQILVSKYAFHLPLYRQQDMFAGTGWTPSRSTLLNILARTFFALEPVVEYFRQTLQGDSHVACDDTSVTLLYPKVMPELDQSVPRQRRAAEVYAQARAAGQPSVRAKMWAYRGVNLKLNVFDFTVSRHRDGPEEFFQGYRGTLLGDCWHGFEAISLASGGEILRAACSAHARRYLEKVSDYPADRAKWLGWYQQLYDLYGREAGLSAEAKLELRQAEARPLWEQMRMELDAIEQRTEQVVLPKSELRKALNYLRNHWSELTRYLDDPHLPIDNNECEQLMKQAALGRKNWLFAGSLAGGERAAGFMTLVSSAHRNDLDVWAYVNDVLNRLLAGETNYEPLLPWNWAAAHPQHIRKFRQVERRDRDLRKTDARAARRARAKRLEARLKKR
ncbi:MAG: IS66 family transposase [Planctomycetota bacterium]